MLFTRQSFHGITQYVLHESMTKWDPSSAACSVKQEVIAFLPGKNFIEMRGIGRLAFKDKE